MRIGYDATPLLTAPRFGIHQHAYEIVRHLTRQYPEDRHVLFFDRDLSERASFDRAALNELGPSAELVPLRTFGRTARLAEAAWLRWHLPREIARHGVDVYHGLAHAIPFARRCPLVLTVHDLMPVEFLSWTPGDRAAVRTRRALLSAIRRASALATVSEATKADVLATGLVRAGVPIEVTPNAARQVFRRVTDGAELAAVKARYGLPDTFLLTVGADTPRRNYARLVEAFGQAQRLEQTLGPLVVVGNTDWALTRMFQRAGELGLLDRLVFCRGVGDTDLAAIYTLATAYVCPSLHEGFGMPVVEAMACETPILCSDIPALREVAGEGAAYFDPTDVGSLCAVLRRGWHERGQGQGASASLAARAQRFRWEAAATTAHSLYTNLHERRRRGTLAWWSHQRRTLGMPLEAGPGPVREGGACS